MASRYRQFFTQPRSTFSGGGDIDQPGPEIVVHPFAAGEVTPEAGIIRTITSLYAGRRAAANFRYQQDQNALARRKDALEVQALEGKVNAPRYSYRGVSDLTGPEMLAAQNTVADNTRGDAGLAETKRYHDADLALRGRIADIRAAAVARKRGAASRYKQLEAAGKLLDAQRERDVDASFQKQYGGQLGDLIQRVRSGQGLSDLGANQSMIEDPTTGQVTPATMKGTGSRYVAPKDLDAAVKSWTEAHKKVLREKWEQANAGKRQGIQDSMFREAGVLAEPDDSGTGAPDESPEDAAARILKPLESAYGGQ